MCGWSSSPTRDPYARTSAKTDCRDIRPPLWLRKTADAPLVEIDDFGRSRGRADERYAPSALAAMPPIGTTRSLPPFPKTRMNPSASSRSVTSKPVSSLARRPQPYRTSRIVRSRSPAGVSGNGWDSSRSTSSMDRTSGNRSGTAGRGSRAVGWFSVTPSRTRNLCSPLTAATRRSTVDGASPRARSDATYAVTSSRVAS